MTQHDGKHDRRWFLRTGLMGLAMVPAAGLIATSQARAQEKSKLSPDNPQAKALKYTHDASTVDAPSYKEGANCANCALYTGGPDDQWGGCNIFPQKLVNADGWCTAWAKKAG